MITPSAKSRPLTINSPFVHGNDGKSKIAETIYKLVWDEPHLEGPVFGTALSEGMKDEVEDGRAHYMPHRTGLNSYTINEIQDEILREVTP